jgi:hypothetical protein
MRNFRKLTASCLIALVFAACQTTAPAPPADQNPSTGADTDVSPQICKGGYCDPERPPPPPPKPQPAPPAPCPAIATASVTTEVFPGNHVSTDARLCADGTLKALTHTWTNTWLGGFHGHVVVRYLGAGGIVLGTSSERVFGVDGRFVSGLGGTQSERFDAWSEASSVSPLTMITGIEVLHATCPILPGPHNYLGAQPC